MPYLEFDCSPINEDCVQLSDREDYMPAMREEARRMIAMLNKRFPDCEGDFRIGTCLHDKGSYLEIRFYYEETEEGYHRCNFVENNYPETWGDKSVLKIPEFQESSEEMQ